MADGRGSQPGTELLRRFLLAALMTGLLPRWYSGEFVPARLAVSSRSPIACAFADQRGIGIQQNGCVGHSYAFEDE